MKLTILFGSEHGSGLDVARIIHRRAKARNIDCRGMSISDYNLADLVLEKIVLFIVSTVGQGSEPTPMRKFWKLIMQKGLPSDTLGHMHTAVIGLGDSSYLKFNVVGKKLYKRLISLGAQMMLEIGLGDDAHELGLWAGIDAWLPKFWNQLSELLPFNDQVDESKLPAATFSVSSTIIKDQSRLDNERDFLIPYDENHPYEARVKTNQRVTPANHFQDVRFAELEIAADLDSRLEYEPGAVVMILPKNCNEEVDEFISLINIDPDQEICLKREENDFNLCIYDFIPNPSSIRTVVQEYLDIHSVPRRSFFDLLWKFSSDETERAKLKEFASTDGQSELYNYCYQPKRTLLEVLKDFYRTASQVPLEYLFDLILPLRSRAFSIASCLQCYPNCIQILVAVVQYKTRLRKPRLGLCSNYIKEIKPDDKIRIWLQKGEFIIPHERPLIMVGPGTGVAPFRAFIQERISRGIKDNVLFYGCRYSTADFYFKDEWVEYESQKMLKLYTSFSRETPDKVYVQHEMWKNKDLIYELLTQDQAVILIAGSSNQMPDDVRDCIKRILTQGNHDSLEIEKIVNRLEATKRIQYECWS